MRELLAVLPGTAPTLMVRLELPHADLATAPVEVEVLKDGAPACVATRREPASPPSHTGHRLNRATWVDVVRDTLARI